MKTKDLLVSNLSITEDEYIYKGLFTLSSGSKSIVADLSDLESAPKLEEIKTLFSIEEPTDAVSKELFSMVLEKSSISSRIKEGKDYLETDSKSEDTDAASSLDMS